MRRSLAPHLFAAASLALAACTAKVTPTGEQLIPAEATLLIGVDLARVVEAEMFGLFKPALARQIRQLAWLDIARDCGVDPVAARVTLIAGTDGLDSGAVVVTGEGVGDETRLRCAAAKLAARSDEGFSVAGPGPDGARSLSDHAVVATVVDPRTVVFATGTWIGQVADRLENRGQTAMQGPTKPLFARADRQAHVWFAGLVPAELARTLATEAIGVEPKDMVGALDLAGGLRVDLAVGFGGVEQVKKLEDGISNGLAMIRMMGPMIGLDAKTLATIKLFADGEAVRFSIALTVQDAMNIAKRLQPPPLDTPPEPQVQ